MKCIVSFLLEFSEEKEKFSVEGGRSCCAQSVVNSLTICCLVQGRVLLELTGVIFSIGKLLQIVGEHLLPLI